MTWRTKTWIGAPLGLALIAAVIALDIGLVNGVLLRSIRAEQVNFATFLAGLIVMLSLPLLAVLGYQTLSCLTLRYHLDRNGLRVRWTGAQLDIPIREILRLVPGQELDGKIVRRRGVRWPGHERGEGLLPGLGRTRFLATRPLEDQIVLVTPGLALGISPRDTEGFLQAYYARLQLGPNRLLDRELYRARLFTWPVWQDRTAWILLGAAILINLGLFAYFSIRFPTLDPQLPLHFTIQGTADRIGTRMELFALPIIGSIVLATNALLGLALYKEERPGSYLLWGAAAAVQVLFWLAAFSIVA